MSIQKNARNKKYILNCIGSRNIEKDWQVTHAKHAQLLSSRAVPAAKDLRETWWSVGDQGETGSCVGWAAADAVLRWHFVKAKMLNTNERLSMRYLWMAAKESDEYSSYPTTFIESDGTSLKSALDIARKFGIVIDSVLPFASGSLYGGEVEAFYAIAAQKKIASYFNLGKKIADWKRWLAFNGPILTRLDVDETWDNVKADGKLKAYKPKPQGAATRLHLSVIQKQDLLCAIVGEKPGQIKVLLTHQMPMRRRRLVKPMELACDFSVNFLNSRFVEGWQLLLAFNTYQLNIRN